MNNRINNDSEFYGNITISGDINIINNGKLLQDSEEFVGGIPNPVDETLDMSNNDIINVNDLSVNGNVNVGGEINAEGDITGLSDINYKKNINKIEYTLDKIERLNPVTFKWKQDSKNKKEFYSGFIAQEVQKVLPEIVYDENPKKVTYIGLIPYLTKAIQELKIKNDELNYRIEKLENN